MLDLPCRCDDPSLPGQDAPGVSQHALAACVQELFSGPLQKRKLPAAPARHCLPVPGNLLVDDLLQPVLMGTTVLIALMLEVLCF